jgi:mannosyltransferase OCH1-like enzyme
MSKLLIPKIIHRIWIEGEPLPDEFEYYGKTWAEKHPDWEMKLWTNKNMIPLQNQKAYNDAKLMAQKADIARFELLYNFGGVYVDCDFECLKNIEALISNIEAFAAIESPGIVCPSIMGCTPKNHIFKMLIDDMPESIKINSHLPITYQTGPIYITTKLRGRKDITIFRSELFYPYLYTEKYRKGEKFPNAYAVHHWSGSWL